MAPQFLKANGPSVISLTLIGFWFVLSTSFVLVSGCQEPAELDKQKHDLYFSRDAHESLYTLPYQIGNLKTLDTFNKTYSSWVKIEEQHMYGRAGCYNDTFLPPSQQNSTCPWYYVTNNDPNRFPVNIWEARCSCPRCLEFYDNIQTSNQCMPVLYNILVLRRYKCIDGTYGYQEVLEPIQTGCMCTRVTTTESTKKPHQSQQS